MRTAEGLVSDLRALGRTDDEIRIVANVTHGGRLVDRVEEILSGKVELKVKPHVEPQEPVVDAPEEPEHVDEGVQVPEPVSDATRRKSRML